MSAFGDGTFKQRILDFVKSECEDFNYDYFDAIGALTDIITELAATAYVKDKSLARLYQQAKEQARDELLAKLRTEFDAK